MANENGEWIMHGLPWDNPLRIRTWQELINYINEVGFLPLFKNEVEGFSAEEHTSDLFWWSGDPEQDPWYWREIIARSRQVAYGKFFNKKAGFISRPRPPPPGFPGQRWGPSPGTEEPPCRSGGSTP